MANPGNPLRPQPLWKTILIHGGLFIAALITTTFAGAELTSGKYWLNMEGFVSADRLLDLDELWVGLPYALAFLTFLSFHEFGHYFTARYHKVKSSLPYYIPFFIPVPGVLNIGSFGAVIRLRKVPSTTRKYFDIGIAGPLAGFVISLLLLGYGFTHLPDKEAYIFAAEPDYESFFGYVPSEEELFAYIKSEAEDGDDMQVMAYHVGTSILFEGMKAALVEDKSQLPSHFDLLHYPFLFVGYITLFFTALNLLPIGQLDGGHIIYGMFGRKTAGYVARITVLGLLFSGGTGLLDFQDITAYGLIPIGVYALFLVYVMTAVIGRHKWKQVAIATALIFATQVLLKWNFPDLQPNMIWLIYTLLSVRMIKLDHPPALYEHRVNRPRQILGWVAIAIFFLCFSPAPLSVISS